MNEVERFSSKKDVLCHPVTLPPLARLHIGRSPTLKRRFLLPPSLFLEGGDETQPLPPLLDRLDEAGGKRGVRVSKLSSSFLVGDPAGDRRRRLLQAFNKQSSQSALLAHNRYLLPLLLLLPFFVVSSKSGQLRYHFMRGEKREVKRN